MASASPQCTPASVIPFLERCGYAQGDIVPDYRVPDTSAPGVLAFAHAPHDARTSCIAVAHAGVDPKRTAEAWRAVGAPVILLIAEEAVEWWQPRADSIVERESIPSAALDDFFHQHETVFAPESLYRAKTCGRLRREYQLEFVDQGLLPFIENEMGQKLSRFLESVLVEGNQLAGKPADDNEATAHFQWMFESAFHLLAGKILHEKNVSCFRRLDMGDYETVINRVREHYGKRDSTRAGEKWQEQFLAATGRRTARLSSLAGLTTETLALIYESTLVSKATRQRLGTHSTPGYLIDYTVWGLSDWIEAIPVTQRHVYEPCCGHAGFLIASMRLLRDMYRAPATDTEMHEYLKARLHGFECDPFALEIARLGLTLADVPNPNGWDLKHGDIFRSEWPTATAPQPDIILMNPPFEDFKQEERQRYADNRVAIACLNKTAEVVARTLPRLNAGGVFGLVVPQGFLHEKNSRPLRRMLCDQFELREITLLPDGVFSASQAESALLLGRRHSPSPLTLVQIGRVDEKQGLQSFREREALSDRQRCLQERLASAPDCDLRIPRLDDVWEALARLPRLGDLVDMGQGFTHKGADKLHGSAVVAREHFTGAKEGFVGKPLSSDDGQVLHALPREVWVSLAPEFIAAPRWGTAVGLPQLVLNYGRASREPWRLKALLDPEGHAVNSRFIVLRPRAKDLALEFLWALVNSPVGNGYAYCHLGKRDNLVGELRKMPVPRVREEDISRVTEVATRYLALARRSSAKPPLAVQEELRSLLFQVDAEVLRLYDLTPRLERRLLNLFSGHRRRGVPFTMTEYFPADFTPCIPLHDYLSPDYKRTTAGELRKRLKTFNDPDITAALRAATEAFTLDEEA